MIESFERDRKILSFFKSKLVHIKCLNNNFFKFVDNRKYFRDRKDCLDLATDSYWIYTYVRNILSLFLKLLPGTLTICMVLHENLNFMKKTKFIFEFISNLVVLVSTVFILALFFFSFMLFPPRLLENLGIIFFIFHNNFITWSITLIF